jgi:hypothetical protein
MTTCKTSATRDRRGARLYSAGLRSGSSKLQVSASDNATELDPPLESRCQLHSGFTHNLPRVRAQGGNIHVPSRVSPARGAYHRWASTRFRLAVTGSVCVSEQPVLAGSRVHRLHLPAGQVQARRLGSSCRAMVEGPLGSNIASTGSATKTVVLILCLLQRLPAHLIQRVAPVVSHKDHRTAGKQPSGQTNHSFEIGVQSA